MELRNIQFYITYAFLFACVFFVGFDNISLFQRIFPYKSHIDIEGLASVLLTSIGGLILGLLLFRRIIKKQPLEIILKMSLLASAFFSWLQFYLPNVLDLSSLHIQTITVFLTNISMGIFLYSSKMILKDRNHTSKNLTTTLLWIFFIIGMLALAFNGNGNLELTPIISSITYILGFISVMTFKGNDFMEIKNSNPYSHLGILIGIIYLFTCYFLSTSQVILSVGNLAKIDATFIIFASLLFWFKPSINKASVVLFLIFSQILG